MLPVGLQQGELFVRASPNLLRKRGILPPKGRRGAMLHGELERPGATIRFVIQSLPNGCVEAAGGEIVCKTSIDGLRVVPVKPRVQFVQLFRREGVDGALDILYGV